MDVGLVLLRVMLACVLYAHATQKVFGWFSGPGLAGSEVIFEKLGQRPGRLMAIVAATCELTAAILLLLGIATPLGAAIAVGTMFVAGVSMSRTSRTFWNVGGGGEYPFVLATAAAALGFTGAGALSLDRAADAPWYGAADRTTLVIGCAAVLLAFVAAIPPLARVSRSSARATAPPAAASR
jgi:putative oxidoreductase